MAMFECKTELGAVGPSKQLHMYNVKVVYNAQFLQINSDHKRRVYVMCFTLCLSVCLLSLYSSDAAVGVCIRLAAFAHVYVFTRCIKTSDSNFTEAARVIYTHTHKKCRSTTETKREQKNGGLDEISL